MASSASDSLGVSWQVGPGRTERLRVLLTDQDRVLLKNVTLQNTVTSAQLDGLQPGTLYTVTVVTEAVGLQSSASRQAVTGRCYEMFWFWFSLSRQMSAATETRVSVISSKPEVKCVLVQRNFKTSSSILISDVFPQNNDEVISASMSSVTQTQLLLSAESVFVCITFDFIMFTLSQLTLFMCENCLHVIFI